jgi:hypothetical protein
MIDDRSSRTTVLSADRLLRVAALVYAAFLFHTGDHLRRGLDVLTAHVLSAGTVSGLVAVVAIALALLGARPAPPLAVAHGTSQAFGVAAVHRLPPWGALSNSLPVGNVDVLSWIAVLAEIAGAIAFAVAGARALRRRERPRLTRARPAPPAPIADNLAPSAK